MTDLLAKYFSGNISEEERKKVLKWRNANDQNAEEFFECSSVWNNKEFSQSREQSTKHIFESIMSSSQPTQTLEAPATFSFRNLMKYAAIVLIAAIGLYAISNEFKQFDRIEMTSKAGEIKTITLPDGSMVYLNENSSISYDKGFGETVRMVSLKGKAFFEVERDESRTFIVQTEESNVKVLGTSFMVDSDGELHETEVVVESGKVAVESLVRNNAISLELVPGEAGKITNSQDKAIKYKNQNQNYLAWKTRVMSFKGNDLKYVVKVLQDAYHIEIDVDDSNISNCRLTAIYDNQPIDSIMEILGETFAIQVSKTGESRYSLSGGGC